MEADKNVSDLEKAYDAETAPKTQGDSAQPARTALLARPGAFLKERQRSSPDLLLGMGDNFGPEFGASIQQEFSSGDPCNLGVVPWKPGELATYAPESLYKSEARMPNYADCDNVTRFLMAAGYRAVVPGREDFLYSGTWLRRIANLLRSASDGKQSGLISGTPSPFSGSMPNQDGTCDSGHCAMAMASFDHKLHILAANLRVSIVPAKDAKPPNDKNTSCPLLFAPDLGVPVECGQSDSTVSASMEWLSRVDSALKKDIQVSIKNQAQNSRDFARQLIKNEIGIFQTILNGVGSQSYCSGTKDCLSLSTCLQAIRSFVPSSRAVPVQAPDCSAALAKTNPGENDLVSLIKGMDTAISCFASESAPGACSPLLEEPALRSAQRLLLQAIYNEQLNTGFTIAEIPGGQHVLIIGVVGKETMQEVAPDFFRVSPDTFDCRTPVSQSDPVAVQSSPSPACLHKQKLSQRSNPQGSAATNGSSRQSANEDDDSYAIAVGDPLVAAEAVLRAVWAHEQPGKVPIVRTILMAQMPATEAEEVGDRLRYDIGIGTADNPMFQDVSLSLRPRVDLVLSEAQDEHISGNQVAEINPLRSTVVLTPSLGYESIEMPEWYPPSIATISPSGESIPRSIQIENRLGFINPPSSTGKEKAASGNEQRIAATIAEEPRDDKNVNARNRAEPQVKSAAGLLESVIAGIVPQPPRLADLTANWQKCTTANCQNQVLTNYLLHTLQIHYKTSAAMLKRRDLWFGEVDAGYDGYDLCEHWAGASDPKAEAYCQLHVALDRVLWRGDYAVRVLVDGTTLASALKSSSQATAIETSHLANDLHWEWLSTFGLVSDPPTNLVNAASGPESFSLPGVSDCNITADPPLGKKSAGPTPPAYCIDGFTIASDAAYWIVTSGQLAEDQSTYKDIGSFTQNGATHFVEDTEKSPTGRRATFLTTAIAEEIIPVQPSRSVKPHAAALPAQRTPHSVQDDLARIEAASQKRNLMQLDISKFAAGYTFTTPSLDDTDLGNDLSGVSNTQATTPHSAELDLEATARAVTAPVLWPALVFGIQNDFEFDHKRTGNTSGKPATVTYQLNSETAGAFAQVHIPKIFGVKSDSSLSIKGPRDLPRFYGVIAPYQYQRQIVGTPLYFGYLIPPYTKNPSQQLTVTIPISDGFSWKSGLRIEAGGYKQAWAPDSGSYAEVGPEYVILNKILYGVSMPDLTSLPNPVTTHCMNPCLVTAGTSITSAVQGYYKDNNQTLNGASNLMPLTRTVHAGGLYWTAHVQKVFNMAKTYSVSFDTAGDSYLLPGYTLPTQTRYAINNKLAFNMNFLGNISFSPTYSVFNFENQGVPAERIFVNTTSFEVMLKWYYSRDTQSQPFRLFWFSGPKSGDQTASTKLK